MSLAPSPKRRIHFTRDARLSVRKFTAGSTAPDSKGYSSTPDPILSIATLTGYALLWNTLSDDRGGYKVRLLPGSANFFNPTMALFHHNFAAVIGNTQNGTLRIMPDDIGVRVEIDLPDTTTGNDVEELVEQRYVQGMSFAMTDAPIFTMTTEGGQRIMNISKFTADEITVTAIPSFTDTSIEVQEDDENEADVVPHPGPISAASNNSSESKKGLYELVGKLQKYKLAILAELQ